MDSLTKALALARLGVKVFPAKEADRRPLTKNGFYDGTIDFELIATWFTLDYPDAVVGVWAGGSDLVALDLDRGKANGKDGFVSMESRKRTTDYLDTIEYTTASGGKHVIWDATGHVEFSPAQDFDKMEGVDVRGGGSYFIWWGNEVPDSRQGFGKSIPEWLMNGANKSATFTGKGFSGSVKAWLEAIPDDILPSGNVRYFMDRIPAAEFGHVEMVDLAWGLVRLGSERETGVKGALVKLQDAWLRAPYDTPEHRKGFDVALRGAINKAGRVQNPVPAVVGLSIAMERAIEAGVGGELKALERKVSETVNEIDYSRSRKEMFKVAAEGGLSPATALGIVIGSKAFANSTVSLDSAWFGDGEPSFHSVTLEEEADTGFDPTLEANHEEELKRLVMGLSAQAAETTYLTESEQIIADSYNWWGNDYLAWVQTRLKHFNKPYHVGAMWAALSTIVSPWGKVPLQGYKPTDCNLYLNILGESTSGKSEAWGFGKMVVDAVYGINPSPIIGDVKRSSAMSLHRTLILRDGQPTLVYSDEVQGFFQDLQNSHWQGTILADLSDVYGGDVSPKNTMNDKEISGKRARALLTTYLTGIADMSLDAISIDHWRSGLFYRFLWAFGEPRKSGDFDILFEANAATYTDQMSAWAREFKRVGEAQGMKWGAGRVVQWDEDARVRMVEFNKAIDAVARLSPLYDTVMIPANGRFLISIMKCATIVALTEMSEKVKLEHVLIALSYAGPWHKSMMLAVEETGKEAFEREVEKAQRWITRNAIRQLDKRPVIQRSAMMRAFRPNEIADRLLRQLTEEGWLLKSGDVYELMEEK